jgi:hypothetical protein
VVVVGRRTSVSQADAQAMAQTLSTQLVAEKVPLRLDADSAQAALARLGVKDPSACNGRRACLVELGRQLSAPQVISLSVSQVDTDRSIAFELLDVADASVLEKDALILPAGTLPGAEQFAPFIAKLKARLPTPGPDAPLVEAPRPRVEPVVQTPLLVVAPLPPAPRSRVVPVALGVGAVVALGVATALLVTGLNTRADAYRTDGMGHSPYSASEVQTHAASGAVQLGVASGLAAVGLGLGTTAVITW